MLDRSAAAEERRPSPAGRGGRTPSQRRRPRGARSRGRAGRRQPPARAPPSCSMTTSPRSDGSCPSSASALTQAGSLPEAERVLAGAVLRASARGEQVYEAHALVGLLFARLRFESGPAAQEVRRRFPDLLATFSANGDDLGLDRLWRLRALVHWLEARSGDAEEAWEVAVEHAAAPATRKGGPTRCAGWRRRPSPGPMPVVDAHRSLRGDPDRPARQPARGGLRPAAAGRAAGDARRVGDGARATGAEQLDAGRARDHHPHGGSLPRGVHRVACRRPGRRGGLAARWLSVAAGERRDGAAGRHRRPARPCDLRPGPPRRGVRPDPRGGAGGRPRRPLSADRLADRPRRDPRPPR